MPANGRWDLIRRLKVKFLPRSEPKFSVKNRFVFGSGTLKGRQMPVVTHSHCHVLLPSDFKVVNLMTNRRRCKSSPGSITQAFVFFAGPAGHKIRIPRAIFRRVRKITKSDC
jgi:hypothetical protein